jgi:hypothetical protein
VKFVNFDRNGGFQAENWSLIGHDETHERTMYLPRSGHADNPIALVYELRLWVL